MILQHYDLGHRYYTYSFFEQCPHRVACARCDFYVPKGFTKAQLIDAKNNLQRMVATIPLTDDEKAAVEDGAVAVDHLLSRLADVPTPAGPTPRQMGVTPLPMAAERPGGRLVDQPVLESKCCGLATQPGNAVACGRRSPASAFNPDGWAVVSAGVRLQQDPWPGRALAETLCLERGSACFPHSPPVHGELWAIEAQIVSLVHHRVKVVLEC